MHFWLNRVLTLRNALSAFCADTQGRSVLSVLKPSVVFESEIAFSEDNPVWSSTSIVSCSSVHTPRLGNSEMHNGDLEDWNHFNLANVL